MAAFDNGTRTVGLVSLLMKAPNEGVCLPNVQRLSQLVANVRV